MAPTNESTQYAPRIRTLVEAGRVHGARELVQEALRTNPLEPGLSRWRELLAYPDQWVAVLEGSLVAHASTLRELEAMLDETVPGAPVLLHRFH